MFELFTDNYILYIIFLIIFLISGFVKGVTGIGLPLTSIALLTFFINPLQAIGLNMIPVIVANFPQYISAESPMNTAKKYKVFAITMLVFIFITSFQAVILGDEILKLLIGILVVIFALDNLFRGAWSFDIKNDRLWQLGMGSIAGIIVGLTSIWGVPIIIYLILRKASPQEFVDTTGFLFLIAVIPATIGYYYTGVFLLEMVPIAIFCAVFAVIGMRLGRYVRLKINAETFKKVLLCLFFIIGVRLISSFFGVM